MTLLDITKDLDITIKERIDYIFQAFQKQFPNVRYDERATIVGIGEPEKYLLCYFRRTEDNNVLVKFKANDSPVTLMENLSSIDSYINATVIMFKENNFPKKQKKEKSNSDKKGENTTIDSIEDAGEEKAYLDLVASVVEKNGETKIEDVASKRLTNALKNAGIRKITDLSRWSYRAVISIKNFGTVCYNELKNLLIVLNDGEIPEKRVNTDYKFLFYKATKNKVRKYYDKLEVKKYLLSINYDENNFEKGTIGRALCLRYKMQEMPTICFSENIEKLKELYLANKENFSSVVENTQALLFRYINEIITNERNADIVCTLLGQTKRKYTLETLGNKYEITRERVRQVFKKELTRLTYGFNLNSEEGVIRSNLRNEFLKIFSDYSIDAFILYLMVEKLDYLEKAFRRVILYKIPCPENMDVNLNDAYNALLKKNSKSKGKSSSGVKYNGFELMIGDDGEILTDIELLDKLKKARLEIANRLGVPAYWIYHNKHLVTLATFKPVSKEMYGSFAGFTEKTWNDYGIIMVEIIKEHLRNKSK